MEGLNMELNPITSESYSSFATKHATFPLKDSKDKVSFSFYLPQFQPSYLYHYVVSKD